MISDGAAAGARQLNRLEEQELWMHTYLRGNHKYQN